MARSIKIFVLLCIHKKHSNREFDETIVQDLFKKWDLDGDDKISIDDFFNNYVTELLNAKYKLKSLSRELKEIENQIKIFRDKLNEAKVSNY